MAGAEERRVTDALHAMWMRVVEGLERPDLQELARQLRPVALTGAVLRLEAPSRPVAEYVRQQLLPIFGEAVAGVVGARQIVVDRPTREQGELFPGLLARRRARTAGPLNARYTFGTFVIGAANQFAHAASHAVGRQPGDRYNPLFLYGGVGLGKTHLAHAIGHEVLERHPGARVVYLSAELFMTQLVTSLRRQRADDFKRRFRDVDVLIVDDVHALGGRERTQEEFFHTFNALYELRRQIVLTADRVPTQIPNLEERLRNRFEWGLVADLRPPDLETRVAIVAKKAEREEIPIDDTTALAIAECVTTNVRELEGAITLVAARASLEHRVASAEFAREVILAARRERGAVITFDGIAAVVAAHYEISAAELLSRRRSRHVAVPRQVAMFLCRRLLGASFPRLGELFDRDHSTVLHAVHGVEARIKSDADFDATVRGLEQGLKTPNIG